MEYLREAIAHTLRFFVRKPSEPQPERWFQGYVEDLRGKIREGFQPEEVFEFRKPGGEKVETPILDYLTAHIGGLDAWAEDADLPDTLP